MKTGILGGTFNPIHTGHLILADQAYHEYGLDRVLVIPSGLSYRKKDIKMPSKEERFEMVSAAVSDVPYFIPSDIDIRREGYSYTADSIRDLRKESPEDELYYIVGADTLRDLPTWREPEVIFKECVILAAVRNDDGEEELKSIILQYEKDFGARIFILHAPGIDISSTMVREYLKEGKSVRYLLPEALRLYLEKNKIYE